MARMTQLKDLPSQIPVQHRGTPSSALGLSRPIPDAGWGAELSLLSPLAPCVTHCPAPLIRHPSSCPRGKALPPPPSISRSLHCLTTVHYAQPIIAAPSLPLRLDSSKNIGLAGAAPSHGSGKAAGAGAGCGGCRMHRAGGTSVAGLLFPIWPPLPRVRAWDSSLREPACAAGEGSAAPWEQPAALGRAVPSPCAPCPAGTPHGAASSATTRRPDSAAGLMGGSAPSPRSPRRVLGPEAAPRPGWSLRVPRCAGGWSGARGVRPPRSSPAQESGPVQVLIRLFGSGCCCAQVCRVAAAPFAAYRL